MPTLPTLTISDQITYDRVIAAFGSTPAAAAVEFRTWLRQALRDEVISRESRSILDRANNEVDVKMTELKNMLDGTS